MKRVQKLPDGEAAEMAVVGLATAQRDYKACYLINNALDLQLSRYLPTENDVLGDFAFPFFTQWIEDIDIRYDMIANKQPGKLLLKKYKTFDYFFVVSGYAADERMQGFLPNLKDIDAFHVVKRLADLTKKERLQITLS